MKPEIKARWLEALRSGKYKQGRGKLRQAVDVEGGAEYCCLGVLCDLAAKEGVGDWVDGSLFRDAVEIQAGVLPPGVQAWARTAYGNPVVPDRTGGCTTLAAVNDQGATFEEIADLIEKYL